MTIYVFDLDGTLIPARKTMTDDFAKAFLPWLKSNRAFIVTGSDFVKVQEQMSEVITNTFTGIYCAMGKAFWQNGGYVYLRELDPEQELLCNLEMFRKNTNYPYSLFDNYIEKKLGL